MTPTKPYTIRAQVSNDILRKVGVLFDNTPKTILAEVLQNCRRAGADLVKIDCAKVEDKPGSYDIVIEDNGSGVADFQTLLTLGGSGWNENIQENEVPAGMGFFSLCAVSGGVYVTSGSNKAFFDKSSFQGETSVSVEAVEERVKGTRLAFRMHVGNNLVAPTGTKQPIPEFLWVLLKFYPVDVLFNGEPVPREDFLKEATFIAEHAGLRIGIYDRRPVMPEDGTAYNDAYSPPDSRITYGTINFHGLVINHTLLSKYSRFRVLVDVTNVRSLDLVLPSRDKVVCNDKLEALALHVENALFQYLASSGVWHSLPFAVYETARSRGFDLNEAAAIMSSPSLKRIHDSDGYEWVSDNRLLDKKWWELDENSVVCDIPTSELAGLVIADRIGSGLDLLLVAERLQMCGYSWYPKRKLTRVVQIVTDARGTENVCGFEDVNAEEVPPFGKVDIEGLPEKIELELTFSEEGKADEVQRVPAWCAFDTCNVGEDGTWIVSKEYFDSMRMDSSTLADLFFEPYEDSSTSASDQESEFHIYAEAAITRLYDGEEKALTEQVTSLINDWNLQTLLRENKIQGIVLAVADNGAVTIKEFQFKNADDTNAR